MDCKCMYLSEQAVCTASLSNMVPKLFDYDPYCNSEEHYRCPILLAYTLRDGYRELMKAS